MATKTITIDMEAYHRLKHSAKQENESFSQTIKRVVPEPIPAEELISMFRRGQETLERGILSRRRGSGRGESQMPIWSGSMACLDTTVLLDLTGRGENEGGKPQKQSSGSLSTINRIR